MILSSHTEMSCLTSEGTGKNHPWQVEVDAQLPAMYDVGTSYSPPVIDCCVRRFKYDWRKWVANIKKELEG